MTVEPLLADSRVKLRAVFELVFASAATYRPFRPDHIYSPQEREPYDALSDRFLRAFESSLKFFRTWERVHEADVSETFRDLLLRMEKVGLISGLTTWISLRDLRHRVVHDYLPDELAALYAAIIGEAVPEFRRLETAASEKLR
jgi:hypothetical protein